MSEEQEDLEEENFGEQEINEILDQTPENETSEQLYEDLYNCEENFVGKSKNPLSSCSNNKPTPIVGLGAILKRLFHDGGPIMEELCEKTAYRAAMVQPPYAVLFEDRHIELFGMIAKTLGLQTGGIITMLTDLILILLRPSSTFDTQFGYDVNYNFLKLYVGQTCSNKSRLMKFVLQNAIQFLNEQNFETGIFYGDFTKVDLIEIMKKRLNKILLLFDEEMGLKFKKMKKGRGDAYESTRVSLNIMNDGDGLQALDADLMDEICKFGAYGATQLLPLLDFLLEERSSGDAMTFKWDIQHLPIGFETGDFGSKLLGVPLVVVVRGIVFTVIFGNHGADIDRWTLHNDSLPFMTLYFDEKQENERRLHEKRILEALYENPIVPDVDTKCSTKRHEKNVIQRSVGYQVLDTVLRAADRRGSFYVRGAPISHNIRPKFVEFAVLAQQKINTQREEIELTVNALENAAANRVTFEQADKMIRLQYRPFHCAKEVLKSPGWFTTVQSIVRLKRRQFVKRTEVIASMKYMSQGIASHAFSGTFVDLGKSKIFIKGHPRQLKPEFLLEIGMTVEEYEECFYASTATPSANTRASPNWQKFVETISQMYPNYLPGNLWFQMFREGMIINKGMDIVDLRGIGPDRSANKTIDRKELLTYERIRGLEEPGIDKRIERIENRIGLMRIIRKTIKHDFSFTEETAARRLQRKLAKLESEERAVFLQNRLRTNFARRLKVLDTSARNGMVKLETYKEGQEKLLRELRGLLEQQRQPGRRRQTQTPNRTVTSPSPPFPTPESDQPSPPTTSASSSVGSTGGQTNHLP